MIRSKNKQRLLRKKVSIRKKVSGTPACPRMSVFRSLKNVSVQLIDDTTGKTLASVSTLSKEHREALKALPTIMERCKFVGKTIAALAIGKKITTVVFDRNGLRYHGRVKAVADGAREAGLKF